MTKSKKVEEANLTRDEKIFGFVVASIILFCIGLYIHSVAKEEAENIFNEGKEKMEILSSFHIECYKNKSIERYEVIDIIEKCIEKCNLYPKCIKENNEVRCTMFIEETEINCYEKCEKTERPYLRFYNETICEKEILVREVENEN